MPMVTSANCALVSPTKTAYPIPQPSATAPPSRNALPKAAPPRASSAAPATLPRHVSQSTLPSDCQYSVVIGCWQTPHATWAPAGSASSACSKSIGAGAAERTSVVELLMPEASVA